ncbi:stage II sporulation protein Q [Alkalihalobacillus xiaoxiensis]|uniref:Stage II sporulation protein Q n=1 Tax=Shouchella xiaoxiensis TaxID=766895 RepID=A0ABS2SVL8_9BACI|nr:M23 family metallopeptidase [Shouchella xiaoxiensis]MBM7839548.1 stage II sporulation protein Q [Shouchella xiaoxiensis]
MKEEKNSSNKIQKIMGKRWVLPGVYLAVAAGLLSAVFFMQNGDEATEQGPDTNEQPGQTEEPTLPVAVGNESFHMPVDQESEFDQVGIFYDAEANLEEQEQALVYYDSIYRENKGIDLASANQESFPVMAAMSGVVTKAMKDSVLGFVIEVDHGEETKTHYSSLSSIEVKQGDEIKQGDVVGEAGKNVYNEEAGIHVHFEVRHDGVALNPADVFEKSVEDLDSLLPQGEDKDKENEETPEEEKKPEENEQPENNQPAEGEDTNE